MEVRYSSLSNASLIFISVLAIFSTVISASVIPSILFTFLVLIVAILIFRDPVSPEVLLLAFIVLYTVSFPVQAIFFDYTQAWDYHQIRKTLLGGQVVILGFFIASAIPILVNWQHQVQAYTRWLQSNFDSPSPVGWYVVVAIGIGAFVVMVLHITQNLGTNALSKYELRAGGLSALGVYFAIPFYYFLVFSGRNLSCRRVWLYRSFLFILPFLFYFLYTGERDVLVRVFLIMYVLGFCYQFFGKVSAIIILILGLLAEPTLQSFKAALVIGVSNHEPSFRNLFAGEFSSQGRNFYWALQRADIMSIVYENSIWRDFLRFLYLSDASSVSLFGSEVMGRKSGAGIGFSLFAQLYFFGGYLALFFLGVFSRLLVRLFEPSRNSSVSIFLYSMVLFGVGYSMRGDIANLLAGVFKVGILPIGVLIIFLALFRSKGCSMNNGIVQRDADQCKKSARSN